MGRTPTRLLALPLAQFPPPPPARNTPIHNTNSSIYSTPDRREFLRTRRWVLIRPGSVCLPLDLFRRVLGLCAGCHEATIAFSTLLWAEHYDRLHHARLTRTYDVVHTEPARHPDTNASSSTSRDQAGFDSVAHVLPVMPWLGRGDGQV